MKIIDYINETKNTTEGKKSIIFYSLFVITNRIETIYNSKSEELTLKQLMLLILVSISEGETFTRYGEIMGSSRQNIKTLALSLEKKSYVSIRQNKIDKRAFGIYLTDKTKKHFKDTDEYYTNQIQSLFSKFTNEEINTMFNYILKLFEGIQEMEK